MLKVKFFNTLKLNLRTIIRPIDYIQYIYEVLLGEDLIYILDEIFGGMEIHINVIKEFQVKEIESYFNSGYLNN